MKWLLTKRTVLLAASLVAGLILMVYMIPPVRHYVRTIVTTTTARLTPSAKTPFPDIDTTQLSSQQAAIIDLVRAEYAERPISYDAHVLKYTQGTKEAWCADFVSWVMKESGKPYSNPYSGSWRIPGVYTLQDYYKAEHRYQEVGHYTPQIGDVAFYIGRRTFGLFSRGHVALVIHVDGDTMTTIGGNEGGRLRLTTQPIVVAGENNLIGFGTL